MPEPLRNIRVLVCGGRRWGLYQSTDSPEEIIQALREREALWAILDKVHGRRHIALMITGGAPGADTLAHNWAVKNQIPTKQEFADWNTHGRKAGPLRNAAMLLHIPQLVIAFPGGSGTANMIYLAKQARVPVWEPIAGPLLGPVRTG